MVGRRLSVRSTKASEIAHRLACRKKCTVTEVVERALDDYDRRTAVRESAKIFYKRISEQYGVYDLDLEQIIKEGRVPHEGIDL